MERIELKRMRLENYKSFSSALPGRRGFSCELGHRTKVSGRNREGKSTILDAYFDVLTGKLADGSLPDKIRPHDENGVDIDRVDIVRELGLEIDGKPVTVTKKTAQKWRKPRGQSEEVFDGNVTTYSIDGFETKQKQFTEWQEGIADPDVLLMCSNARPFLNTVQKSTAEARKILERMSGFKVEDFIAQNSEYAHIEEITKGHAIEDALKQLRKNLNEQKKAADTVRTQLSYEKSREPENGKLEIAKLQKSVDEYNKQVAKLDEQEKALNDVAAAYDRKSKDILDLKFEQSEIVRKANEGLLSKRREIENDIFLLTQDKRSAENNLRLAEMDFRHANAGIERYSAELKKAQEDWKEYSAREYPLENLEALKNEKLDEDSLVCPTCGQDLPREQADKIRTDFEQKKAKRIKDEEDARTTFYEVKGRKLASITEDGNFAAEGLRASKKAKEEAERKVSESRELVSRLVLAIEGIEREFSELPESVDLSGNIEYQEITAEIAQSEESLKQMSNGTERRKEITEQRNACVREAAKLEAEINKIQSGIADHELRIEELEEKLKTEGQRCADIEKNIDTLLNFSIEKNKALADMVNPYFKHFQFVFCDFTQDGGIYETLRIMCDGTDFFSGLNRSDQILCEIDLVCGLQKLNNLNLPVWVDNSEAVNAERLPEIEQQMIILEVSGETLKVETF